MSILYCSEKGQWDNWPPTCEPVSCGELQAPEHGELIGGRHFVFQERVLFLLVLTNLKNFQHTLK